MNLLLNDLFFHKIRIEARDFKILEKQEFSKENIGISMLSKNKLDLI